MPKLTLDNNLVDQARASAKAIAGQVQAEVGRYTTTSVERATLRLMGVDGIDDRGIPLPNVVVDRLAREDLLGGGAAWPLAAVMAEYGQNAQEAAQMIANRQIPHGQLAARQPAGQALAGDLAGRACNRIRARKQERDEQIAAMGMGEPPYLYVIVATGNIFEDVRQAQAAARQGADIVAVIRSTGQSLLDYVPYGATSEGFGGTYATQENFRIMRQALDEAGSQAGRYIRLTNYCSGLCMPEIAVMGAFERLDVMLNDCMYGIIFRDINMKRTFIDQFFSRMINAYAGVIINTGEDNYLTTADAYEQAHTVIASQFINEQFALLSGLCEEQMGLGHAFEICPDLKNGFLWELAHAQLVRQLFPRAPIKYMPPTKYMTGNIFKGHVQDTLFNVASLLTGQSIHLLGMMTEAIHTPLLQDRYLSIENARYIFNTMRDLGQEIEFKPDGQIQKRAGEVLRQAVAMLAEIEAIGLMEAIRRGMFADIGRNPAGGKGLDGVVAKCDDYYNPFPGLMLKGVS